MDSYLVIKNINIFSFPYHQNMQTKRTTVKYSFWLNIEYITLKYVITTFS